VKFCAPTSSAANDHIDEVHLTVGMYGPRAAQAFCEARWPAWKPHRHYQRTLGRAYGVMGGLYRASAKMSCAIRVPIARALSFTTPRFRLRLAAGAAPPAAPENRFRRGGACATSLQAKDPEMRPESAGFADH